MASSKKLQAPTKPQTKAGRRVLRWIDWGVTEDRMLYAVIGHGPTVADLRAAILEVEREARHAGFLECGKRTLEAVRRDRGNPEGPLVTITGASLLDSDPAMLEGNEGWFGDE